MTKYIKFNQVIKSTGGFITDEAVLVITAYSLTKNVNLTNDIISQSANINFSLYKSDADKVAGELPFQVAPSTSSMFPMNVYLNLVDDTELTIDVINDKVLGYFVEAGYDVELIES
jgi:hypothetical protein